MRYPPAFLEEIKTRLPVSELVRRKVKLVKAGREWKGLSPFSQEKTPSFYVNDQKQFFHDFSSGKHGSVFDFVMETEGLSFPDAVERLARDVGLPLPASSPELERKELRRASLHEALELAAGFFQQELNGPKGLRARAYLAERAIGADMQRQFRLGYATPERFGLRDWLSARGVDRELMIEAGLLIHGEEIASPYDRFRDRIMFPIGDRSGRTIAFGGRALDKNAPAKYLNSPETALFHKGAVLYNYFSARKAVQVAGSVVVVEGYIDVIAMTGAGFANVVAPLGTALTVDQCGLLWTMAEEPILCLDGDRAGRKAADRAIDLALPLIESGKTLRFAFLPEGLDPDDLVRAGGAAAVREVLASAKPLIDALWAREFESAPLDTPERRASLERRLLARVQEIRDETLKRYYREEIVARLRAARPAPDRPPSQRGRGFQPPGGRFARGGRPGEPMRGYVGAPPAVSASLSRSAMFQGSGTSPREASILVLILNHPGLLGRFAEDLAVMDFGSADLAKLRDALVDLLHGHAPDPDSARSALGERGLAANLARVEAAAPIAKSWCARPEAEESDAYEALRQAMALHRRTTALHRDLQAAAVALGRNATEADFARVQEIQSELMSLDGREAVIEGFGATVGRQMGI